MLRIHFGSDDLARTTLATEPDPLWEILLSRFRLHEPTKSVAFRPWMRKLSAAPPESRTKIKAGIKLLSVLAPFSPYFPDFLTPLEAGRGIDHGLDALLSTPRPELRTQLERLADHRRLPGWTRYLADGEIQAVTLVGTTFRDYYDTAITPYSDIVHAAIAADVAHRTRSMQTAGVNGLLDSFRPMMRWNPPVLEANYDVDRDLYLRGRGIRFVPSFFCNHTPVTLADPTLPPVLVYPVAQEYRWTNTGKMSTALDMLMGSTRANVLRAIDIGSTTTQLARRLGTSAASVSRHTAVLREAGLITSHRDLSAVLHTLTPLGIALLNQH